MVTLWKQRHKLNEKKISRQELSFLPGALEIQETPPAPWGRAVAWLIISLFTIAVFWSFFSKVDVVTVAEGKIIASGRIKQIQPYDKGVIKKILVHEGQKVKRGEPLVILDQSLTYADQSRIKNEWHQTHLDLSRTLVFVQMLRQFNNQKHQTIFFEHAIKYLGKKLPSSSSKEEIEYQQQLLIQLWQQYLSEYNALKSNYSKQLAEQQSVQALIKKFQMTLPMIKRRSNALKKLVDKKMAAEMSWLELEEKRIEQQQEMAVQRSRKKILQASIEETQFQMAVLTARKQAEGMQKIGELRRQQASMAEELHKATSLYQKQILTAPVSGKVQELSIHTIGGIVTPAQKLMVIVPENDTLQVEAVLENKDIGFVYEGQNAEIKIHTFPFTKYGVIDARVINLSDNAIADEKRGLIYKMRLLMHKTEMLVNDKTVKLIPGMAVTAEIKTGKRRLIEYFLAPILRYKQESVRER